MLYPRIYQLIFAIVCLSYSAFAQQPQILSISKMNPLQRDQAISQIAEQFLVLEDGAFLQVKRVQGVELSSELYNQRIFKSSKITSYKLEPFDDNIRKNNLTIVNSKISQCVGGDKYLVDKQTMLIEIPGDTSLVEGDPIVGVARYIGPYNYTTVLGANKRVDHYLIVNINYPTEEQIIQALDDGTVFQIVVPAMLKCPQCGGLGTIRNDPNDSLKSVTCNVCERKRKIPGGLLATVTK